MAGLAAAGSISRIIEDIAAPVAAVGTRISAPRSFLHPDNAAGRRAAPPPPTERSSSSAPPGRLAVSVTLILLEHRDLLDEVQRRVAASHAAFPAAAEGATENTDAAAPAAGSPSAFKLQKAGAAVAAAAFSAPPRL